MNPHQDKRFNIAGVIERVLGDRDFHLSRIINLCEGTSSTYTPVLEAPRLRVYVATRHGICLLNDDRSEMPPSRSCLVEIVKAEFADSALSAGSSDDRILCHSECKGEMLYHLGQDNRRRSRVEYVAFLDDDLELKVSDLLSATAQASDRGYSVFQLQLSTDSHAVWPIFKEIDSQTAWSRIGFVEIMAPVISQRELDFGLLDVLKPFKSGFGWDFYLLPVLADLFEDFKLGIYRGAKMRHSRPVTTSNETTFSNGMNALQEEELIRSALVLALVRSESFCNRYDFLLTLQELLESNTPALVGVASGLHSLTTRYWFSRELETQLQKTTQEHHTAMRSLQDTKASLEQLRVKLDVLTEEGEQLKAELYYSSQLVTRIYDSATWKIGRLFFLPLRILRRFLRPQRPEKTTKALEDSSQSH